MITSAYNEHQNRWLKPGSSFYYSTLHLSQESKQAVSCIYVYTQEILHIVTHYKESTVAMSRLQWWQEELKQLQQNQARHPISQALLPVINKHQLPHDLFENIWTSAALLFQQNPVQTWDDFDVLAKHLFASSLTLQLLCCGYPKQQSQTFANKCAPGLLVSYLLERFGLDIKRGFYYFPLSLLKQLAVAQNSVTDEHFSNQYTTPSFDDSHCANDLHAIRTILNQAQSRHKFCSSVGSHAYQAFSQALYDEALYDEGVQAKLIMAKIIIIHANALVTEICNSSQNLLTHHIQLTPLRYYWLSVSTRIRQRFKRKLTLHSPS